tara:strand:- start:5838 stop:6626 length:789 start_codon:yes stop_codon:yes gene_type:complete
MNRIDGKIAIITGSGSGIGRASCELLAEAGARIVATDINEERAEATAMHVRDMGGDAIGLRHDVSSETDWSHVTVETTRCYGGLDVLVNNAGISVTKECRNTTLDDWRSVMDVNLTGVFLGVRAAVNMMSENKTYGSIINIASIAGLMGDCPAAYSASKSGVRLLSKSVAVECGRKGYRIRINTICPGTVETPMTDKISDTKVLSDLKALYPLKRFAQPIEIAKGVLFLASDDSSYITGSDLVIDGGATAGIGGMLIDLPLE